MSESGSLVDHTDAHLLRVVVGVEPAGIGRGVVVWSNARGLMRALRPQAWVVLHDLVFDAEWIDGRWVAPSSARLIADHLRIDPGTAAAALRQLRDSGVAELTQSAGSAGRFGLASYTLRLPSGIEVVSPCVGGPHTVAAHTVEPDAEGVQRVELSARRTGRRRAAPGQWSQDALDFGTGDS